MKPTYSPTFTPWPSLTPYPTASATPTQSPFPTDAETSNTSAEKEKSPTQNNGRKEVNDNLVNDQQSKPSGPSDSLEWSPTVSPVPTATRLPSSTPYPTASPTPTASPFPTDASSTGEESSPMTSPISSKTFPTAPTTSEKAPFPTNLNNYDSKTTSPWPTYIYPVTFGPTKTWYPTASPTPTASPFPTEEESESLSGDSRGYGHSCHGFEKAMEHVDEEIVFTYTAESKITSMEFVHELEIHLLDHASAEVLECAPDSPLHVYQIRYAENDAASDVRSCKTNQPESKACWILQTKMLITTDRSSKTMAKREVLEEIKSQLNHGKLWTDKFDDVTFTKYLGPELTEMSFSRTTSPMNDPNGVNAKHVKMSYALASVALISAIFFVVIVLVLYFRRLKIRKKLIDQKGESDDGSLEITELLSRSRLRLKENLRGNGYDENEYFGNSSQRSTSSRKEMEVKDGYLNKSSIGESNERIDSNISFSDTQHRYITSPMPTSVEYLPSTGSAVNLEYRERLSPFDHISSFSFNESKHERYMEESASILAPEVVYEMVHQNRLPNYDSYKNAQDVKSARYLKEKEHSNRKSQSPRNQSLFNSSPINSLEKFEELRGSKDYRPTYSDYIDHQEEKLRGKLIV
jgi:hypothetical protein